jgi:thiamine biosynthesis lipoprotein
MVIASDRIRRARPLLGTFVEIEAVGTTKSAIETAIASAFGAISIVHRLMSFHDEGSDVSRLNREAFARPVGVHPWTFRVLEAAVDLHLRSNGMFDIAVAPILQALGMLPKVSEVVAAEPHARALDSIELLEGQLVRFRYPDVRIDLGGIAKGFAVDCALDLLRGSGAVSSGLVNAGGDLGAFGEARLVHIRHPCDPRRVIGGVEVTNEALASSARRFDPFHSTDTTATAIIDPGSGKPANSIDGATVRAPSCMIADALTKAVMIAGTNATGLLELYNASALVISTDGDVQISPDWQHAVHLAA